MRVNIIYERACQPLVLEFFAFGLSLNRSRSIVETVGNLTTLEWSGCPSDVGTVGNSQELSISFHRASVSPICPAKNVLAFFITLSISFCVRTYFLLKGVFSPSIYSWSSGHMISVRTRVSQSVNRPILWWPEYLQGLPAKRFNMTYCSSVLASVSNLILSPILKHIVNAYQKFPRNRNSCLWLSLLSQYLVVQGT